MTEQSATVVNRSGISAIWLVPFIAFLFVGWLMIKSAANQGVFITIEFDNANGIEVGQTEVRYRGLTAGKVTNLTVSDSLKSVIVEVEMIGSTSEALTDNAQFWFVTADVSLQGIKGLDTLISGSYINMEPDLAGTGEPRRHFIGLKEQPPLDMDTPGLHIKLMADTLGSIEKNSPVTFKQLTVGYVSGYRYLEVNNQVEIDVFIEPEFSHLVKTSSRFWNASGISVNGSLGEGLNIRTQSLAAIIAGGIAFDHDNQAFTIENARSGEQFVLHADYDEAKLGDELELTLPWNSGIESGASIVYQGMMVGRIEEIIDIDAQQQVLIASAKVNPRISPYLTTESQFYVVSPAISLTGMSSVSSLLKGTHLSVRLSEQGETASSFTVLAKKPPLSYQEPGLHLTLHTTSLSSLTLNSGVFFQEQKVGSIQGIKPIGLSQFEVAIFVEPAFAHLVTKQSRFWHASGLKVSAGITGVEIEAPALQAMLSGGVAFDSGDASTEVVSVENGQQYKLYSNSNVALQRSEFALAFAPELSQINTQTKVRFQGQVVGSIHEVAKGANANIATVGLLPEYEHLLNDDSQFFLVEPELSLSGMTDTQAIFGGPYIGVYAGEGASQNEFVLLAKPPKKPTHAQGLQLVLQAKHGGDINRYSQLTYRGIRIGQVDDVSLNRSSKLVDVHVTIDEEYRHLVTPYTRFYNAGGINIKGNFAQFNVKTQTLDSVLKGGISLFNPAVDEPNALDVSEGDSYPLFSDVLQAENAGLAISIYFADYTDIKSGMVISHRGQTVGQIDKLIFDNNNHGVTAFGYLNDLGKGLAKQGSQFWLDRPEVGLVGNKNVGALITGGSIGMLPGEGEPHQHFNASSYEPALKRLSHGLNIRLQSDFLGSVRVGNPVLYRQVKVGEVIGVELSESADQVFIYLNIPNRFAPLVKTNSQFWNASGLKFDAGLFSGLSVEASSIETLIAGGIAFATPPEDSDVATQGASFILHNEVSQKWLSWQPQISLVTED